MVKKKDFFKLFMIMTALVALVAFSATPALCESNATPEGDEITGDIERPLPDFGTNNYVTYSIAPCEFVGYSATQDNMIMGYGMNRYLTSSGVVNAGAHLPTGARVYGWELDYYDGGSSNLYISPMYCPYNASGCTPISGYTYSVGSGGYGWVRKTGVSHTVNNFNNSYLVEVSLPGTSTYRLVGAHVYYYLQISPAPGWPTFSDVNSGDWYYQGVEALARSGITVGCGGGKFCPNIAVSRAQMAVFLARALGLHYPY